MSEIYTDEEIAAALAEFGDVVQLMPMELIYSDGRDLDLGVLRIVILEGGPTGHLVGCMGWYLC